MDPITSAVTRLIREHETAWHPPPNAPRAAPSTLAIATDPLDRNDLVAALRVLEWQPDNRRPYCVVEGPFVGIDAYLSAVAQQLRSDVATVDKGLSEDGEIRPPAPLFPSPADLVRVLDYAEALAAHLVGPLEGLVLVLAPKRIEDATGFRALVGAITRRRTKSASSEGPLYLDVIAPDVADLDGVVSHTIRFTIDREALFEHLRNGGTESSQGPSTPAPVLAPEKRAALEKELGQPLMSLDAGRSLKFLIMDAGKALSEGKAKIAVRKFRAARMLCEATGLENEALLLTVALGSAYVQAENVKGAEACFERARKKAQEKDLAAIETPALWGLGATRVMQRRFDDAEPCYHRLLELADESSPMRTEAARMIEVCKRKDPGYGVNLSEGARA